MLIELTSSISELPTLRSDASLQVLCDLGLSCNNKQKINVGNEVIINVFYRLLLIIASELKLCIAMV